MVLNEEKKQHTHSEGACRPPDEKCHFFPYTVFNKTDVLIMKSTLNCKEWPFKLCIRFCCHVHFWMNKFDEILIPGGPKNGRVDFFRTLLWSTVIFFPLLDRTSFPDYNNTKIIKFGWRLFILWVISYGLSFSGFAIHFSLVGGPPKKTEQSNF